MIQIDYPRLHLTYDAKDAEDAKRFLTDWAEKVAHIGETQELTEAKPAPVKAPEPVVQNTQPIEQNHSVGRDGLAAMAIEYVKKHGRDKFNDLAAKYGAKRIGEVKDEDLTAFRGELEAGL
jgi:hypothetical protein